MPIKIDDSAPKNFPKPDYLTLQNFKRGVITLINESRLPKNALKQAQNIILSEDGQPSVRPGTDWYGTAPTYTTVVTNLIPNPSFEVDTTSWAIGGSGTTITQVTSQFYVGTHSLQIDSGTGNHGATVSVSGLTIGTQYTIQARMKGVVSNNLYVNPNNISATTTVFVAATGGWDFVSATFTATATSGTIPFGQNTASTTCYIDAVMLTASSTAPAYFDGSSTGSPTVTYAWTGTSGKSTSTQTTTGIAPGQIDGFDYFDSNGVAHLLIVAGGLVFRSTTDGASWDLCSGATLTVGVWTNMNQNGSFLYLTNGTDNIVRYDGSTTLQTYTVLTTPAAPTAATIPASPGTGYTYYYKISAVNQVGFSIASTKVTVTHGVPRSGWDKTTNNATLTLPAYQATQTRADIFFSEDDLSYYYLDSITTPNLTYKDDGSAIVVPSTLAPTGNTTQGPKVAELVNIGVRQFGVRDSQNRYRIWFTGAGNYASAFSSAYDGGYLDWQPGGKYTPVKVADYRSGKGDPIATVWCDSEDGLGSVIQMTLGTLTVGQVTITVPSAYQLPGSRGTTAPNSVVNVLDDYYFYNSQAIYSLGSRPQLLNILSTDEVSANIRPNVRRINRSGEKNIAAFYFSPNIYFSVPINGTTNDTTMVFNTEMKAWLPEAFTIGFKKFLRYADVNHSQHLLALKDGDSRLTEISDGFYGDYKSPFSTSLATGLYKTNDDIFEFQFVEEGEFELANPQGDVYVELLGIDRTHGFRSIKIVKLSASTNVTNAGWDVYNWDKSPWDNTSVVPTIVSESSEKRYFAVQKELNAVQWHIFTTGINAKYTHRTFQTWGTATGAGHPSKWRLNGL